MSTVLALPDRSVLLVCRTSRPTPQNKSSISRGTQPGVTVTDRGSASSGKVPQKVSQKDRIRCHSHPIQKARATASRRNRAVMAAASSPRVVSPVKTVMSRVTLLPRAQAKVFTTCRASTRPPSVSRSSQRQAVTATAAAQPR